MSKSTQKKAETESTKPATPATPNLLDRATEFFFDLVGDAWRFIRNDVIWMRVPLTWFAVGLALVAENYFNLRSGAGPRLYIRGTSIDLGIVAVFIGALLLLAERRHGTDRPAPASLVYRGGLALLVVSAVAHSASALAGMFGFGSFGSFSIFDVGIWLGGAIALFSAHHGLTRTDLPGERLFALASTALFVVGLGISFVESHGARSAFSSSLDAPIAFTENLGAASLAALGLHPGAMAPGLELSVGALTRPLAAHFSQTPPATGFSIASLLVLLAVVGAAVHAFRSHRVNTPRTNTDCGCIDVLIVAGLGLAFYLPTLTTFGLLDPWEGHYAEVARQMLVRSDWISQFWENEWFWSKPVGLFWLEALSFTVFGVSDFAIRIPHVLLGVFGITTVYLFCRELLGRRTAALSALILATMPYWFFVSRQGLTDMPFVALVTAGLGFFGLAMFRHKEGDGENPRLTWVVYPLLFLTTLPQYSLVADELEVYGGLHALVYLAVFIPLAIFISTRRDARSAYLYAFYLCCGIATLSKGLLGFALPGAIIFAYILVTAEWRIVIEARIPSGIAIVALATLPWHIAMWARHGMDWWREYFEQHHLNRISAGIHGDNLTGFDYFVRWGAYGAFPWVAFLPVAASRFWKSLSPDSPERRAKVLVGVWMAVTFTLFTMSATKFHHYILPMMPALAIAIGYGLSEFWNDRNASRLPFLAAAGILVFVGYDLVRTFVGSDVMRDNVQFVNLFIYKYQRPWPWGITPDRTMVPLFVLAVVILMLGLIPNRENVRARTILRATGFLIGAAIGAVIIRAIWPESTFRFLLGAIAVGVLGAWLGTRLAEGRARLKWSLAAVAILVVGGVGGFHMLSKTERTAAIPLQMLFLPVGDDNQANQTAQQYAQAFDHAVPTPGGNVIRRFVGEIAGMTQQLAQKNCADAQGRQVAPMLVDLCERWGKRAFVDVFNFAPGLVIFVLLAMIAALVFVPGATWRAIVAFASFALIWAGWAMHDYMLQLNNHWTQREYFATLHNLRADQRELPAPLALAALSAIQSPFGAALAAPLAATHLIPDVLNEDALAAYQMNWRTETYYSRNEVDPIHKANAERRMINFAKTPGRRFVLIEKETISNQVLRQQLTRAGVNRPMREWMPISNKYEMWSIE